MKGQTEISILGLRIRLKNINWESRIVVEKSMTLTSSFGFGGLAAAGNFLVP